LSYKYLIDCLKTENLSIFWVLIVDLQYTCSLDYIVV